jgi:hypothetical protein
MTGISAMEKLTRLIEEISLSPQVARVLRREMPVTAMRGVVVCIEDLHANASAQQNISAIVDQLLTKYSFRHIYTEGIWGPIDSTIMKLFPDIKIKKEACDYLLKKGELTGQEYAVVMRPELDVTFSGVDDERLYTQNKKAGAEIAKVKDRALELVAKLMEGLLAAGDFVLSRDFLDFTKMVRAYDNGKIPYKDYVSQLYWYGKLNRIPPSDALRRRMQREGIVRSSSRASWLGRDSASVELDQPLAENEDFEQELREDITEKLCLTEIDSRFVRVLNFCELTAAAFQAQLTSEQARKFLGMTAEDVRGTFQQDVGYIEECVRGCVSGEELHLNSLIKEVDFLWDSWRIPATFYRSAKGRSHIMAQKTAQEMVQQSVDRAMLVVGGFHAFHCCRDLLKKHGMACVTVRPVVGSVDAPNYWRFISGDLLTTEEIITDAQKGLVSSAGSRQILLGRRRRST